MTCKAVAENLLKDSSLLPSPQAARMILASAMHDIGTHIRERERDRGKEALRLCGEARQRRRMEKSSEKLEKET